MKTVLITGTSAGGLGDAFAAAFAKKGYRVFATLRTPSKLDPALAANPNVEVIALDVTSADSIAAAVKVVAERTGGSLDVLVNNSGGGYSAPLLDIDLAKAKALYELNFFAIIAMIQAFAPLLIKARGVVVNTSSVSGELYDGYVSMYGSSKAALTNASEAWRLELAPFGVRVITLVIGVVTSRFFANVEVYNSPPGSLYGPVEVNIRELEKQVGRGMPADVFADQVVRDVEAGTTGVIWRGNSAALVRVLKMVTPTFFLDRLMSRGRGFDKLSPPKDGE